MDPVLVLLAVLCLAWVTTGIYVVLARHQPKLVRASTPEPEDALVINPPADPEHRFLVCDRFDGLWETWICRDCGANHLRKRPGLD